MARVSYQSEYTKSKTEPAKEIKEKYEEEEEKEEKNINNEYKKSIHERRMVDFAISLDDLIYAPVYALWIVSLSCIHSRLANYSHKTIAKKTWLPLREISIDQIQKYKIF